jgi:ornithine cyclodeaminase/alanine dehydrogenase-like protein (mu-crystallin family)
MPAMRRGTDPTGAGDLVGMKWVAGFDTNKALGIPAINAVVILNDATTGLPIAVMDGGPITAMRTAAVSGVALRHFAPTVTGRPCRAALIGAGVQGRSHLPVLGAVLPGIEVRVFDPSSEHLAALVDLGGATDGIGAIEAATSARDAIEGADVVVTAAAFGPKRQMMTNDWLEPDALVVPVDYATYCSAEVARDAGLFLIDHRGQLDAGRANGLFDDFPEPVATIGEAVIAGTPRPAHGRVVTMHLGVGLADVVFGSAILARAAAMGLGIVLPR